MSDAKLKSITLLEHEAGKLLTELVGKSAWFEVTPLPYGVWQITVKAEEAIVAFLEKVTGEIEAGDACRFCLAEGTRTNKHDCHEHCREAHDGRHLILLGPSDAVLIGYADDDKIIVDIPCANCGRSGSVQIPFTDVQW